MRPRGNAVPSGTVLCRTSTTEMACVAIAVIRPFDMIDMSLATPSTVPDAMTCASL
ncbi:hypothetical protein [Streptomyces sp. NBC_01373]|uniref:hypothetical protein n=1 Tax=Streptomyces sp. NBC_01373 TaxID=2903843 RepID=UPI002252BAA6|nr:hypothetical protein [Streptomyces sp. NBC_01373]MCX4706308.1 hypothetical protein [Streptomyces sp. NBC_01373]